MSLGDKVADAIPDSVYEYVHEHPRVVYLVTVPMVAYSVVLLVKACRLHVLAEVWIARRASEAARAASEALGG